LRGGGACPGTAALSIGGTGGVVVATAGVMFVGCGALTAAALPGFMVGSGKASDNAAGTCGALCLAESGAATMAISVESTAGGVVLAFTMSVSGAFLAPWGVGTDVADPL